MFQAHLLAYTRQRKDSMWRRLRVFAILVILTAFFVGSARLSEVDMDKLLRNLPKIGQWVSLMLPPYHDTFRQPPTGHELLVYLRNAAQTVAIATISTSIVAISALIPAVFAARTLTPSRLLFYPTRWFLSTLRASDSFIFALYFVAAVGLGPFAGVLGVALHTWGSLHQEQFALRYATHILSLREGQLMVDVQRDDFRAADRANIYEK